MRARYPVGRVGHTNESLVGANYCSVRSLRGNKSLYGIHMHMKYVRTVFGAGVLRIPASHSGHFYRVVIFLPLLLLAHCSPPRAPVKTPFPIGGKARLAPRGNVVAAGRCLARRRVFLPNGVPLGTLISTLT